MMPAGTMAMAARTCTIHRNRAVIPRKPPTANTATNKFASSQAKERSAPMHLPSPKSTSTTSSTLHATHCAPETVTRESRNEEADVDVAQGSGCCNAYATAATEARA